MPHIEENLPYNVPYQIYIDPSNLCNFRCHFCPTGNKKLLKEVARPAGMMRFEIFEKFVSELSLMVEKYGQKPDTIYLFKDGEPTMNPDLPEMISLLNEKKLADCIHITSNASRLTPSLSEKLISAGLTEIRFSVYGVNDETYNDSTNRNIKFDDILENIKEFWKINEKYGFPVNVNAKIMNLYTEKQIEDFKNQFEKISTKVSIEGLHKWSNSDKWEMHNEDKISKKDSDFICAQPFSRMTILFNGDVTPCCVDWSHQLVVANIEEHSLDHIWNSLTNKLRRQHISNQIPPSSACFDCDYKNSRSKYDKIYNQAGKLGEMFG